MLKWLGVLGVALVLTLWGILELGIGASPLFGLGILALGAITSIYTLLILVDEYRQKVR